MMRGAGWFLGADNKRETGAETAWAVNPRVHALYGERAATEKAKRQQGAETMRALKAAAQGRDEGQQKPRQDRGWFYALRMRLASAAKSTSSGGFRMLCLLCHQ